MNRISYLSRARLRRSRGHLLIELIVVIAIIAILAAVYYGGWLSPGTSDRPDGEGTTIVGRSALKARDTECQNYIGQVRSAISMQKIDDIIPQSLQELNLPAKLLRCPIGSEAFEYDVATQKVKCPHPGHEDF
jgi:prepilin-type N-terminal cleavage/methylation domain-containing protein